MEGEEHCLTLPQLNDDCLLKISTYLGLIDNINLAKTCHRLKDLAETMIFKKYSALKIDRAMIEKGHTFINNVLLHVGSYVVEITLHLHGVQEKYFWPAINRKCKCLKKVFFEGWHEKEMYNFANFDCFENVEALSLIDCNFDSKSNFLVSFRKLKSIFSESSVANSAMKTLFKNNCDLISCYYMSTNLDEDWEIDMLVPKLEVLRIDIPENYKTLLNFNYLKKLVLWCYEQNVNDLLIPLAEKGIMEELQLLFTKLDTGTPEILKRFTKLQFLALIECEFDEGEIKRKPMLVWPPNLKYLTLNGDYVSVDCIISAVKQLKYLEHVDLWRSGYAEGELSKFNDLNYLCQRLFNAMHHRNQGKILSIVLPVHVNCGIDRSQKYLIDSNGLRIYNHKWSHFDAHDKFMINFG